MEANPSGATVDGAAKRINELLANTEPDEPTVERGDAEEPAEAVESEPEALEADGGGDTQPEATEEEEQLYTVKVNGEEIQVTLDDLLKGYMMEADYRQKTSSVSEAKKAAAQRAQELDDQLSWARALIDVEIKELESPEMLRLKESDPDEYLKELDRVKAKQDKYNRLRASRQKELDAQMKERVREESEKLTSAIPEWLDESKKHADANDIFKMLGEVGFKDEEIANLIDHRWFRIAKDAAEFRKLKTADLSKKEVRKSPKAVKPASAENQRDTADEKLKKLKKAHEQSGSVNSAAALLRS